MTENHGVPGSNPGPATLESPANSGKSKSLGSAAETPFLRRVNSRLKKGLFLGGCRKVLDAFCGADVDGEGHPVMGVSWICEARAVRWPPRRPEDEIWRERQRRASSAGGGEDAPRIQEGAAPPVTEVLEYRPHEDVYLQLIAPRRSRDCWGQLLT